MEFVMFTGEEFCNFVSNQLHFVARLIIVLAFMAILLCKRRRKKLYGYILLGALQLFLNLFVLLRGFK